MSVPKLQHKRIAILATDGFEQSELFDPKAALEEAGAEVVIVSLKTGKIKAWNKTGWGNSIAVDFAVADTSAIEFDGLVLPGGVMNPDALRVDLKAVDFIREFAEDGKPIAAICHGPWTLIEAGIAAGKTMTSWPSLKTDITNAGGTWIDEEVAVDGNLVTSRKPEDLPAFNQKMVEAFAQGRQASSTFKKIDLVKDSALN